MNRLLRRREPRQTLKNAPIFVFTSSTIVLYHRKFLKPYRANSGRLRFSFTRNCSSELIQHRILVAKGEGQGPLWSRPAEPSWPRIYQLPAMGEVLRAGRADGLAACSIVDFVQAPASGARAQLRRDRSSGNPAPRSLAPCIAFCVLHFALHSGPICSANALRGHYGRR